MYLRSCIILLCLGYFHTPTMLLINAAGDKSKTLDSRMLDEYQRIYIRKDVGFVGESSRSGSTSNNPDVGSSNSDEVKYFNPVEQFWQYAKCKELNVELENYFLVIRAVKTLNSPLRWVDVKSDVNSFYRALSFWVSGTEENYYTIRQQILDVVRTDQRVVHFLGQENYNAQLLIMHTWSSNHSWPTEAEIVAATLLLNTSIYVYDHRVQAWDLYNQNQTTKGPLAKTDKCIYIQHVSETHYNLVTDVEPDQDQGYMLNPERPATLDRSIQKSLSFGRNEGEENIFYYPVDAAWQDEKCSDWDLIIQKPFHYFKTSFLNTPKNCVKMQRDRNCFFRALSYWLTGTEDNHQIIRKYVAEEIIFNRAIQELYKGNEFLSFKIHNNWATKIEIIASAVLLNTSIFIYSHAKQTWELYTKNIAVNVTVDTTTDKSIYLRQMSPHEFDVVEDVDDYFEVSNYYNRRL